MSCNEKIYIVRDSKESFHKFYLINKELFLKNSNGGQVILKKDILDYALDIDQNGNIHMVYLNVKGELNYSIYNDNNEERNILVVNSNYSIKYLQLKTIDLDIHIFYRVDKLKGNVSSIYHNFFVGGNWIDEEITKIYCPKYVCPYHMDYYKNNIYMLYCKNHSLGEYNIKRFDTDKSLWEDFEDNIIIKDASSLNYFITPNSLEIICFSKFVNNNLKALIRFKSLDDLGKTWSSDLSVSGNNINVVKPVVFYKDSYIYAMWKQGTKIVYRKSEDMINWSKNSEMDIRLEDIDKSLYLSSIYKNHNIKISYIYTPDIEFLVSITKSKINCSYDTVSIAAITTDVVNDNIENPVNVRNNALREADMNLNNNLKMLSEKSFSRDKEYEDRYIEILLGELKLKDINIDYLNEVNLKLNCEISGMRKLIDRYENKLQNFRVKQILNKEKHFRTIYNYEKHIKNLREKQDNLSSEVNKKIQGLLRIIEEKESIIQKLYKVINDKN